MFEPNQILILAHGLLVSLAIVQNTSAFKYKKEAVS